MWWTETDWREQNEGLTNMLFMLENHIEIWNRNTMRTVIERKSAKMRKRVVCLKNLVLPQHLALRWTDTVHEHITKTIYLRKSYISWGCVRTKLTAKKKTQSIYVNIKSLFKQVQLVHKCFWCRDRERETERISVHTHENKGWMGDEVSTHM